MNYFLAYPFSSALYFGVLSIGAILAYDAERGDDRRFAIVLVIAVSLFAGLRSVGVGIDTVNFAEKYVSAIVYGVEPGYLALMRFFALFGSFNFFLSITAFATYGLFIARLWEIRNEISFTVSFVCFYCLYFSLSLNLFRQFLALAVLFWGSRYFFKGKHLRYALIVAVAFFIHKTSVLALLLFLVLPFQLRHEQGDRRTGLLLLSLAAPFAAMGIGLIVLASSEFSHYGRYLETPVGGSMGLMVPAKFLIIFSNSLRNG